MKRATIVLMVMALSITALLVLKLGSSHSRSALRSKGETAPDFALESVEGRIVHLSDFHDKAVLLHFWATSWLPCRVEMQWFEQMHNQYGPQGLQVLGVAMNNADKNDIADYARNLGVDYPVLLGKGSVSDSYSLRELPVTIYAGRDGKSLRKYSGLRSTTRLKTA